MNFVRSAKTSLKFANIGKQKTIALFLDEYFDYMRALVDILWDQKDQRIQALLGPEILNVPFTWLSARAKQCAGKQVSAIVRGTLSKNKKREFIAGKLEREGKLKQARKLRKIIEEKAAEKPEITGNHAELDSRFVTIDPAPDNSFDAWVHLQSLGDKSALNIPVTLSAHHRSLLARGLWLKSGIRLSRTEVTFLFEGDPPESSGDKILGIDIGITTAVTCSDGTASEKDIHGHDLTTIQHKIARRQKGSEGFGRAQRHRSNHIGWVVGRIDMTNIKEVRVENIKHLRRGIRTSRFMNGWVYRELSDRIDRRCEDHGVRVLKVDPSYTSQRCSCCGWTCERNRKGKRFKCLSCGFACDSDLNGSLNISFGLPGHGKKRSDKASGRGFWWPDPSRELIVPDVLETSSGS